MSLTEERSARNEARFRELNEELEEVRFGLLGDDQRQTPFLCECEKLSCTDVVLLSALAYQEARGSPRRFLISPGHVADNAVVVARHETYWLVEKQGEAGRVAEREARKDEAAT